MKEITFINKNKSRWQKFEKEINDSGLLSPDLLADLYVKITDDLAYAKTFYPQGESVIYLNELSSKTHALIYKNKKTKKGRYRKFLKHDYPNLIYAQRKNIYIAGFVFVLSVFIGFLSVKYDDGFARLILGNQYIDMTLKNIEDGDPMAVYKKASNIDMFLGITINNIRVAIIAFVFGVFFSIGTIYLLFSNGIMVGTFLAFFLEKQLLSHAGSVIFLHGTLELFAIVIAGAAGITMGNALLYPKTLKRIEAFKIGARNGIKIILGIIPIFIIAGFIEGFITRYSHSPIAIKLLIILSSLGFIIWYFIYLPYIKNRKKNLIA